MICSICSGSSQQSLLSAGPEIRCNSVSCSQPRQELGHKLSSPLDNKTTRTSVCTDDSGSPENGSILSPLKNFTPRRKIGRTSLHSNHSFQSYFRPTVKRRSRVPATVTTSGSSGDAVAEANNTPSLPSPTSIIVPSSPQHPGAPAGGVFRRQIGRETSFRQTRRPSGIVQSRSVAAAATAAAAAAAASGTPPATSPQRRMSFYERPGSRLGRRNTVVGSGGPLYCPQPLSLRDIYRLSRQGSIRSRHSLLINRRPSTQSRDAGGGHSPSRRTSSKGSVSRHESSRSRIDDSRCNLVQSALTTPVTVPSLSGDTEATVMASTLAVAQLSAETHESDVVSSRQGLTVCGTPPADETRRTPVEQPRNNLFLVFDVFETTLCSVHVSLRR